MLRPKSGIAFLESVLRVGTIFGTSPSFSFSSQDFLNFTLYKIYVVFLQLAMTAGIILTIYKRISVSDDIFVMEYNFVAILFLTNSVILHRIVFSKSVQFKNLLLTLAKFDKDINQEQKDRSSTVYQLIAFIIYVIMMYISHGTFWQHGMAAEVILLFKFYIIESIQLLHMFVSAGLVITFITVFKDRFELLNSLLASESEMMLNELHANNDIVQSSERVVKTVRNNRKSREIRNIGKSYNILYDAMESFNDIFGYQIFLSLNCVVTNILTTINMLLNSFVVSKDIVGGICVFLFILWIVTVLDVGYIPGYLAMKTCEEIQRSVCICNKYFNLTVINCSREEKAFREDLVLITQNIKTRDPCFSAAGFFRVDNSMISTLLTYLVSLVIILVQFSNN